MKAPNKCPMCGETNQWIKVDESKLSVGKSFSAKKAVIGGVLLGPVGLLGGALGKKECFCCGRCGFQHEYDK